MHILKKRLKIQGVPKRVQTLNVYYSLVNNYERLYFTGIGVECS
jgi:hypothetical protein